MTIAPIMSPSSLTNTNPAQTPAPTKTLGQADFLKLLVTQMTSQDPMNPMKDTDFVSQMASFSALEENQTMEGDMAALQANSLLGRTVSLNTTNASPVSGVVSAVQIVAGKPQIVVNGQSYSLSQLSGILPTPSPITNP